LRFVGKHNLNTVIEKRGHARILSIGVDFSGGRVCRRGRGAAGGEDRKFRRILETFSSWVSLLAPTRHVWVGLRAYSGLVKVALLVLLAALAAGCGITPSGQARRECGISTEVEIEWRAQASLTALGLQDSADPAFPVDRRGDVYVTVPDPQGSRTYCIQLDAGTDDMWTHRGNPPAGWDPPAN